jgi:hypothetical protein
MAQLKAGARLRSSVCNTEVMVIAAPGELDLQCGGASMVDVSETAAGGSVAPDAAEGTQLGKRYINEAGDLELLCTKGGDGSIALDGVLLKLKEAKALPSSD